MSARLDAYARAPSAASVLGILASIERRDPGDPAEAAFRSALVRKGREAVAAGGDDALADLLREVSEADPARAEARAAIMRAAWADLIPQT